MVHIRFMKAFVDLSRKLLKNIYRTLRNILGQIYHSHRQLWQIAARNILEVTTWVDCLVSTAVKKGAQQSVCFIRVFVNPMFILI